MRFDVSVISDDIFEHNETFQLSINLSSLPHNVSTVYPNQATVIIINDDCKYHTSQIYTYVIVQQVKNLEIILWVLTACFCVVNQKFIQSLLLMFI